ncbi:MAG: flagellar motor switch protein FliM [Gammaproteobacteria bacterium]|nr:flagellar motor switch protein FliM [Gammaproteobacteria bacterium]
MSNDILSQDEIDALLTGVDSGDVETDTEEESAPDQARNYDFTSQDRIVRGRLPTLDMINERFARNFRISLFNFLRRSPTITAEGVQMNKFGEYIHSLFMPSNLNLIKMKPLRGTALFVLNPTLVYSIVDNFFGGSGKFHAKIEGRDFTSTEMQVIKTIIEKMFVDLKKAWSPIKEIEFEHIGSEVNPHFANIVSPSEVVVISTFHVELDNGGGDIHMTLPYSMIEPIREQLHAGVQSDTAESDERWGRSLAESLKMAPLVLQSRLTKLDMTLRDLKSMKAGDVIPFDFPETVTATIEEVPVFRASYGMSRGNRALKVVEVFNDEKL